MYTLVGSLRKSVGFRRGFTPLALALSKTPARTTCRRCNTNVRPFALSATMHQTSSELSMADSPKLNDIKETSAAFTCVTPPELPGTFAEKFIKMLEDADLIVSASGGEVLQNLLGDMRPMPLTLTVQRLLLERLEKLPSKDEGGIDEREIWEQDQYDEIAIIANHLFEHLMEAESFGYAVGVAIKQCPELSGESHFEKIIVELVRAGLLLNPSDWKKYSEFGIIKSGPIRYADIQKAQFGANGGRGQLCLDTGILTRIIEHPSEKFSPFLRNLLQHNDVATLEENVYKYVWWRGPSGRTPAQARTALLEKGVSVISVSEMNMQEAANKCHELIRQMDEQLRAVGLKENWPWKAWRNLHQMSRNLHLTMQAHLHGRSFVTNDMQFLKEWEQYFRRDGIHVYAVDGSKMFMEMDVQN